MKLSRRSVLGGLAGTAALATPFVARAQTMELVMVGYGSVQDEPLKRAGEELARRNPGVTLEVIGGLSTEALAQIKAAQGASPYHLAVMGSPAIINAQNEGVLEPLDFSKIPNYANVVPSFKPYGYDIGCPISFSGIGIAYNADAVETPPETWEDLWNPEYAGRVGMCRPSSNLGLGAVAAVGEAFFGKQDAFAESLSKWQELDPLVGRSPGLLQQMLERGEIDLCPMWHDNTAIAASTGLPFKYAKVSGPGPLMLPTSIVQFINSDASDLIHEFADILLQPENQLQASGAPVFFGPVVEGVDPPAEAAEFLLSTPEEQSVMSSLDWPLIAPGRSALVEDFDRTFGV
ncbi:ABC transporter substrate-binding protein [Maricaulis maris]|uniref:ABC transporter substrate-binding protein n=1 Tax=Maricaulis maris TaxID=74318 RepID=UPI003A938BBD